VDTGKVICNYVHKLGMRSMDSHSFTNFPAFLVTASYGADE